MEHQAFVTISTFSIHHLTPSISWWSKIFQHAKYSLMTLMKHWPSNMLVTLACCNMPAMTRISLPLVKIISYKHLKGFFHACLIMTMALLGLNYQAKTIHATKSTKFLNSRKFHASPKTKGLHSRLRLIIILDKKRQTIIFFRGYFYLFSWSWDTNLTSFNSVIQLAGEWLGMVI